MPKTIRMPSPDELGPGPRRRFMEALYWLWSRAGTPSAEAVSTQVRRLPDGGASKETIRKMLTGKTVPRDWGNAEAVFLALSQMADLDPERLVIHTDDLDEDPYGHEPAPKPEPARVIFKRLWSNAHTEGTYLHGEMQDYTPPPPSRFASEDPWTDEPPF